jgi:hypothetical protein
MHILRGFSMEQLSQRRLNVLNDKKLDLEKQLENEVSTIRSVAEWKSNRDRGLISKENQFQYTILKL